MRSGYDTCPLLSLRVGCKPRPSVEHFNRPGLIARSLTNGLGLAQETAYRSSKTIRKTCYYVARVGTHAQPVVYAKFGPIQIEYVIHSIQFTSRGNKLAAFNFPDRLLLPSYCGRWEDDFAWSGRASRQPVTDLYITILAALISLPLSRSFFGDTIGPGGLLDHSEPVSAWNCALNSRVLTEHRQRPCKVLEFKSVSPSPASFCVLLSAPFFFAGGWRQDNGTRIRSNRLSLPGRLACDVLFLEFLTRTDVQSRTNSWTQWR